jgi:chaperonin cofactor prefoldin
MSGAEPLRSKTQQELQLLVAQSELNSLPAGRKVYLKQGEVMFLSDTKTAKAKVAGMLTNSSQTLCTG